MRTISYQFKIRNSAWGKHPLNSTEIGWFRFCQNITPYKPNPSFSQKIFITLRSRVQIPVSLHDNQGLTLNRGSFVVSAWGLREVLREVFVISYRKHELLMLIFLLLLWYLHLCIFTHEKSNPTFIDYFYLFNCYSAKPKREKGC